MKEKVGFGMFFLCWDGIGSGLSRVVGMFIWV